MKYYGAIEAGGTKFVCAVGTENGEIIDRLTIPTETPEETIGRLSAFFDMYQLESIGVGSFGPMSLAKESPDFGYITNTPKLAWRNYPLIPELKKGSAFPFLLRRMSMRLHSGKSRKEPHKGLTAVFISRSAPQIGAGAVIGGKLVQSFSHPEMGHILIRRHEKDTFAGNCPYHNDCLEGMASGPHD